MEEEKGKRGWEVKYVCKREDGVKEMTSEVFNEPWHHSRVWGRGRRGVGGRDGEVRRD